MAKMGFGLYKEQIKDCVFNSIEKFLMAAVGGWLAYVNYGDEKIVWAITFTVTTIIYTILFIVSLRDTIKAIKEYLKIRKEWENYGK